MSRRKNVQIDADTLRAAAVVLRDYGVPASATVCEVVAGAIENGTRTRVKR